MVAFFEKTKCLIFERSSSVGMNDFQIENVEPLKDLGIIFCNNIKWTEHVQTNLKNAQRFSPRIERFHSKAPPRKISISYSSFLCSSAWSSIFVHGYNAFESYGKILETLLRMNFWSEDNIPKIS